MSRVQLALNVSDIDEAVGFYSKLFNTEPAKRKPGYANFAIANPPLKLVLIENKDEGAAGTLNHLGVEVDTQLEVGEAQTRLAESGMETEVEEGVSCCYAIQDKVWVHDPNQAPWEIYTVLSDAEKMKSDGLQITSSRTQGSVCCGTSGSKESIDPKVSESTCCSAESSEDAQCC